MKRNRFIIYAEVDSLEKAEEVQKAVNTFFGGAAPKVAFSVKENAVLLTETQANILSAFLSNRRELKKLIEASGYLTAIEKIIAQLDGRAMVDDLPRSRRE